MSKNLLRRWRSNLMGRCGKNGYQSSKPENDTRTYGNILGPLLSKFARPEALDAEKRNKMAEMTRQIDDYELLVRELKEELRKEKLNAKEGAEDLAQEMAEFRYHITRLLEEKCKRRACIEQISLQRIAELEAQVGKTPVSYIPHGRDFVKIDEGYLRFVTKFAKEQQKSYTSQSLVVRNINKT